MHFNWILGLLLIVVFAACGKQKCHFHGFQGGLAHAAVTCVSSIIPSNNPIPSSCGMGSLVSRRRLASALISYSVCLELLHYVFM